MFVMAEETGHEKRVSHKLKTFLPLFFISLLSCAMSLYYLRLNPDHLLLFDDSYITLRFAANFFRYGGITYDGNSYLIGATSPLHIIFIALFGLFLKMETASLVVGIIFFIFSSLLVYLWSFRIYGGRKVAFLAGLMMSICYWLIADSLNGLETTTFIFFSLLTFYLFHAYKAKPFYIIPLILSILTRPEGWFIACALWTWQALQYFFKKDKKILRHLLISLSLFTLLITPYLLLSLYCTGSLLPSTAFSKAIFFAQARFPLVKKIVFFKNGFLPFYQKLFFTGSLFIVPLILFARKFISISYLWFYYISFCLFYFFLFPGAIAHYWYRYHHVFIPMLIIGISGGAVQVVKMCKRRILQISVAVLIVGFIVYNQGVGLLHLKYTYPIAVSNIKHTIDLAMRLKRDTPKDSLIALHDIGVVGYFSDRTILDLVGLINQEISRYYWGENTKRLFDLSERRIIDYLKIKKPDYLVMFPNRDSYFNFFRPDNRKHFKHEYTPHPLRYEVFKCNWEL